MNGVLGMTEALLDTPLSKTNSEITWTRCGPPRTLCWQ